jgi:signal transduction histidine kinase
MSLILITSIVIRLGAMGWSIVLWRRVRDLKMGFLTAMLALMATRQILTLVGSVADNQPWTLRLGAHLHELPGLFVSILAALSVFYLERFILQHRRDTEALVQRDRELQQAQKMEAIGQLAGGVAHDFNNLLTVIQSNADMALRSPNPARELQEIEAAVGRASALTRQLLSFTRTRARELRVVDISQVLRDMQPMLRRLAPERIELVFLVDEKLPNVHVDTTQIGQVLINLVVNAQAAIEDHGTITVRTNASDAGIELSVTDTGGGMDEATMARVFEPLFTTKDIEEGTGLGLSICRRIVHEHGGRIDVESQLGQGSTFRVWLPASDAATSKPVSEAPPATRGSEVVLVAEDEPQVRKVTCDILESLGYRVIASVNGEDALQRLQAQADVALVLADVMMPQMGGLALRAQLAQDRPNLPVLLMSGYSDTPIEDDTRVLAKPFTEEQLAAAVRESIDSAQR